MKFNACYLGFIPDIFRLLQKYNLSQVLHIYLNEGTFPSKYVWKRTLLQHVINRDVQNRFLRLVEQDEFALLCEILKPNSHCLLWQSARGNSNMTMLCKKLIAISGKI
jgi:hypothetical protein